MMWGAMVEIYDYADKQDESLVSKENVDKALKDSPWLQEVDPQTEHWAKSVESFFGSKEDPKKSLSLEEQIKREAKINKVQSDLIAGLQDKINWSSTIMKELESHGYNNANPENMGKRIFEKENSESRIETAYA